MVGKTVLWVAGMSAGACVCLQVASWTQATMRSWFLATVGAVLISTVVSAQPTVNADVVKASERYRTAVLAGDARAVASTYADDGAELPPGHPMVRGRDAIEQRFRELFHGAKVTTFTFAHLETTVDGNVAYDAGTYQQRLSFPSGQDVSDTGKYVAVLKRIQGEWKAAYVIYNSDGSAPPPCQGR